MRPFLAFVGGFFVSLAIFASGVAMSIAYFHAKPVATGLASREVAGLWTAEPRKVDPADQAFERGDVQDANAEGKQARPIQEAVAVPTGGEVDALTTAALPTAGDPALRSPDTEAMAAAHAEWCGDRYRSYRPRDDSYTPYNGGRRRCISPYSETAQGVAAMSVSAELEAEGYAVADEELSLTNVAYSTGGLDGDHIEYCFSRYRSYRPEDNTYQPYGGGPRRQCE